MYMGVAKSLERMVQFDAHHMTRVTSLGSLLVCHYIHHKQMTIHNPEVQLHYHQDLHDILVQLPIIGFHSVP